MSTGQQQDHAPGFRAIRWNMDWITRPLFGIGMALVAIGALFSGPPLFAALVSLLGIVASFEWHRIVARGKPYYAEACLSAVTVSAAAMLMAFNIPAGLSLALVAAGTVAALVLALRRGNPVLWQAGGVLYLALPCTALVALRTLAPHGAMVIVVLFVIVWATDTGALIFGNLIGGPRLAPVLSPAKTWSGTLGGSVIAALAFAGLISFLGGSVLLALAFGFAFSFTAHAGDLLESFVKRRFGIKDSGALIPGHGGVLDRMDSTVIAALLMAWLVFGLHFQPLIGVHA